MPYCQMQTAPPAVAIARTEDVFLILEDGRRLIDGLASWWSACHGYNHPHVIEAIRRQAEVMPHVMFGGAQHEPAATLATRLAAILPGDLEHVFFCDSGSVAVEVAMKMAIQFHRNAGQTQRSRFVSFENAYHGDTTGAMSLCDPTRSMHSHFGGALLQQFNQPLPKTPEQFEQLDGFFSENRDDIAGVFIEPIVQGAGGMRFHAPDVLSRVDQLCRKYDLLWIADELATGFGRTGKMFAIEHVGVVPDIICLGKALTAGTIGFAATVASEKVFERFLSDDFGSALMHGPTFMANPLACAAANASLDLFESEPRLQQSANIETLLNHGLSPCRGLPGVVDVRCLGAIGVVQVTNLDDVNKLRAAFVESGVWIRPFGDCVYVTPSLTMQPPEIDALCVAIVDQMTTRSADHRE